MCLKSKKSTCSGRSGTKTKLMAIVVRNNFVFDLVYNDFFKILPRNDKREIGRRFVISTGEDLGIGMTSAPF